MYYFYERNYHNPYEDIYGGWQYNGLFDLIDILKYIRSKEEEYIRRFDYYKRQNTIQPKLFASTWNELKPYLIISDKGSLYIPKNDITFKESHYRYFFDNGHKRKWRKLHYRMFSLLKDAKNPENKNYIRKKYDYAFWEEDKVSKDRWHNRSWKDQSKKKKQWM